MASRNNSMGTLPLNQGFTVFQPALGASLQFLPALGTPELDTMIDAYVAGPMSIKDKRAAVCVEFCNYSRQTGEATLFFPVFSQSAFTSSPASSMNDSGYGSNFNVSPVLSDSWATPSQSRPAKASKKTSAASSRVPATDFSHIPGMKIMTREGVDVTNSASRGCKTKEQRDHAHLMRIIKACDACKKKKIRCDPSHKKRGVSQVQSPTEQPRQAKKAKAATPPAAATAAAAASVPQFFDSPTPDVIVSESPFQAPFAELAPFESLAAPAEEFNWEQFLQFTEDQTSAIPTDYDFFFDSSALLTPSSGSASSFSPSQAFTPASAGFSLPAAEISAGFDRVEAPQLPYLNPDVHATDYVDFTLYSPASSFLDEEPQQLRSPASAHVDNHNNDVWSIDNTQFQTWARASSSGTAAARAAEPRVPCHPANPVLDPQSFDPGCANIPQSHGQVETLGLVRPQRLETERLSCPWSSSSSLLAAEGPRLDGDTVAQAVAANSKHRRIVRASRKSANAILPSLAQTSQSSAAGSVASHHASVSPTTVAATELALLDGSQSSPLASVVSATPSSSRPSQSHVMRDAVIEAAVTALLEARDRAAPATKAVAAAHSASLSSGPRKVREQYREHALNFHREADLDHHKEGPVEQMSQISPVRTSSQSPVEAAATSSRSQTVLSRNDAAVADLSKRRTSSAASGLTTTSSTSSTPRGARSSRCRASPQPVRMSPAATAGTTTTSSNFALASVQSAPCANRTPSTTSKSSVLLSARAATSQSPSSTTTTTTTTHTSFLQTLALWAVAANLLLPLPTRQVQKGSSSTNGTLQSTGALVPAVLVAALLVVLGLVLAPTVSSSTPLQWMQKQQQQQQQQQQKQQQQQDHSYIQSLLITSTLSFFASSWARWASSSSSSSAPSASSRPVAAGKAPRSRRESPVPSSSSTWLDRLRDVRCAVTRRVSRRVGAMMAASSPALRHS